MSKLAIIIPAYKIEFLDKTLHCIKNQTCQDFHLYVFDDASPYPVKELYDQYFAASENATYKRFDENLGGKDLAAHWTRCVANSGEEEWVWLFSDDDLMTDNCVEEIYNALNNPSNLIDDVLHFNICQIDDQDIVTKIMRPYPQHMTASDYYALLHTGQLDTRMPEFIFKRQKIAEIGGYVSFDLAWKSDNATVTAVTYPGTIFTLPQGFVSWRLSNENVTGSMVDKEGKERKRLATIQYFNWSYHFFRNKGAFIGLNKKGLYLSYFMNIRQNWIYLTRKNDVWSLAKAYDAVCTPLDYCFFFWVWFQQDIQLTKKKFWIARTWLLLTEKSSEIYD